jgi:hypothetical protein
MTIDITATKVFVPAVLFALLSPGLLITPGNTSPKAVLTYALAMSVIYYILAKFVLKVSVTRADILVPAILFVLLSPGMLLTLPPGSAGFFRSGQTSQVAIGVHTAVFGIAFAVLRSSFPRYY